jgi:hypothetical protein
VCQQPGQQWLLEDGGVPEGGHQHKLSQQLDNLGDTVDPAEESGAVRLAAGGEPFPQPDFPGPEEQGQAVGVEEDGSDRHPLNHHSHPLNHHLI